jgi:hypothetical protein
LDLVAYRASKQFRAMTFADLTVEVSDDGKSLIDVAKVDGFLDPGYTPPFDRNLWLITQVFVPDQSMKDPGFYPGEQAACSDILLRKSHPNSTISRGEPADTVVASAMVVFRAGAHTDRIGVDIVKCPYHVPWVWCEWLLLFNGGRLELLGTGSVFPTHSFYAQGRLYGQQDEPTDAKFITSWRHPLTIDTTALHVYPVLTTGAPATPGSVNVRDATAGVAGPISSLPFAVSGSGFNSMTAF